MYLNRRVFVMAAIINFYLWFHWAMIITWTTTLRKFGVCIPWLGCKQSTQKAVGLKTFAEMSVLVIFKDN